jgi:hypothetical protein
MVVGAPLFSVVSIYWVSNDRTEDRVRSCGLTVGENSLPVDVLWNTCGKLTVCITHLTQHCLFRGGWKRIGNEKSAHRGPEGGDLARIALIHKACVRAGFSLHNTSYGTFYFLTLKLEKPAFKRILIIFSR